MRTPPAVHVQADGGPLWRIVRVALVALAGGVGSGWAAAHLVTAFPAAPAVTPGAVALAAALLAGAAAWRATRAAAVDLAFDGRVWRVDGAPGRLEVMIDLPRWLLLRWHGDRVRWIAVSAREAGGAFHGLCAAVHAAPSAPDDDVASTSAVTPAAPSPPRRP